MARLGHLHRVLARALANTPVRLAFFAALALWVAWPLLSTATALNLFRDAHILFSYERNAAWAVLRHGQLPLWDPYYCGGVYSLGTPQSRFVSPTFLLSLLFGPARGEAITIFAMLVMGLEGTFRYARMRGAGVLGSALAAPAFAISGVFIASPFLGWTNFFGFELVPWTLLGVRRALRGEVSGAILAAAMLAWMIGFGGTYATPMTLLMWAFEVGERIVAGRKNASAGGCELARTLGLVALAGLLAAGMSAVRTAPLVEVLFAAPRVLGGSPGMAVGDALRVLTRAVAVHGGNLVWSKQMYTVGAAALAVAAVGLARRRAWPMVILAALAFWAALGHAAGEFAPFPLLKRLPLYQALRAPERYLIFVGLAVAVLAAHGVRALETRARRRRLARVGLTAAALALLANAVFLGNAFRTTAEGRALAPAAPELTREFRQARGNRWVAAYYAPMSRGSLQCMDAYPVPMSPLLRGDLPADEYLSDPAAGRVARRRWSPNAIDLDVELSRASQVRINQNYHPGWRSSVGDVRDVDGLLAIDLPAGRHRLALRFRPRSALAGAACSIAALLLAAVVVARIRRRGGAGSGRTLIAAATLPLAVGGLIYVLVPERPPTRALLRAPSGEAIIAPAPPAGGQPVDARFPGVTLEAVRIPDGVALAPRAVSALEFDWRVTGPVERQTSIYVHLEVAGARVLTLDHQLISSAVTLAAAPRDRTLRDVVPFVVPSSLPFGVVEVWCGLWNARTGKRLPVAQAGGATVVDGRLLVARIPRAP